MASIDELLCKISDPKLKQDILNEIKILKKQKKFGLVFEEHLPEATPLYDAPIGIGTLVSLKDKEFKEFFRVKQISGKYLICEKVDESHEIVKLIKNEVVAVAMFGQPIYPCLKPLDAVKNAPDSDLWHTLIEADNYHALQLLAYLYGGMVDCIYIDPPYNTGDKSWKYNNNYVDSSDSFRHSKWLSMMKKRLVLAKKLLNPKDSVLIVTIDEKEYIHLGSLLEDMFPEANIQMISILIAQKGVARGNSFYRVNEYIYFVQLGESSVQPLDLNEQWALGKNDSAAAKGIVWSQLRRSGTNDLRTDRPNLFYPIIFNSEGTHIISTGDALASDEHPSSALEHKDGKLWLWPVKEDGTEGNWQLSNIQVKDRYSKGYIKIGKIKENTIPLSYLKRGSINKIENEEVKLLGYDEKTGTVIVDASEYSREYVPGSQWNIETHDATYHGTQLLNKIIGKRFSFPKSLYAVHDTIRFFVANKPNALIVDFFAGSGTTLHAVNLLNAEDGGNRRCVMVTNNEVSAEEETRLKRAGYHPGEDEWEKWGIARYVNWPRTKCSIVGVDVNNIPINGTYQTYLKQEKEKERTIKQITLIDNPSSMKTAQKKELVALCGQGKLPQSLVKANSKFIVSEDHPCTILFDINYAGEWLESLDGQDQVTDVYIVTRNDEEFKRLKDEVQELLGNIIEEESVLRPMSDGFAANAQFFKLSFLDKNAVAMDMQFKELLTTLWMKAGAVGECPVITSCEIDDYYIFPDNKMAILKEEDVYMKFKEALKGHNEIKTIFIITDSDSDFREMTADFAGKRCYQLYRDYLDNFSINYERN